MDRIAHRGARGSGWENSPQGVAAAREAQYDWVELDVWFEGGGIVCKHFSWNPPAPLAACLKEVGASMGVMVHLKGAFTSEGLRLLLRSIENAAIPRERIWMVSHRGQSLGLVKRAAPAIGCGQFGWGAAIRQCFCATPQRDAILLNELTITRSIVRKLYARGLKVFASCVWETRSEEALRKLEVNGLFRDIVPN